MTKTLSNLKTSCIVAGCL